ncbi:nitrilase superfamily member [Suhomyces tanzawaensis NRRL Y-17324]|uniref:Nitrilase superfamily member n=1 Tax=Suhomyces tanzawaensis NRRL Y-17324 TaxID=984487 RepID=A0A1E4SFQ5_9ASCO|nr:nitrilase superfamily member [Suhomyces tanzawaensis NRRL Y-17324]ODV78344.1 nitrilase superfamily member [Suhomyces tanzawaensis NRRL Y-17324]
MSLRIAVGQLCSSLNIAANARIVKKLLAQAAAHKVQVLFLPEATDYLSKNAAHSLNLAKRVHQDFVEEIQRETKRLGLLYVAVGIHEPTDGGKRVRNNQLWIDPHGVIVETYQKIHLFDVDIKDGPTLKESNSVEPGSRVIPPVGTGGSDAFQVGLAICYDIRFPELALRLRRLGADIITFPSAFTVKTGEAHWEVLARARAIDTQSYVVMAAQCGEHDTEADLEAMSYGESLIVSPWGEVVARLSKFSARGPADSDGDYYELGVADLDKDSLEQIRRNMPLLEHRRPDVFGYEI